MEEVVVVVAAEESTDEDNDEEEDDNDEEEEENNDCKSNGKWSFNASKTAWIETASICLFRNRCAHTGQINDTKGEWMNEREETKGNERVGEENEEEFDDEEADEEDEEEEDDEEEDREFINESKSEGRKET